MRKARNFFKLFFHICIVLRLASWWTHNPFSSRFHPVQTNVLSIYNQTVSLIACRNAICVYSKSDLTHAPVNFTVVGEKRPGDPTHTDYTGLCIAESLRFIHATSIPIECLMLRPVRRPRFANYYKSTEKSRKKMFRMSEHQLKGQFGSFSCSNLLSDDSGSWEVKRSRHNSQKLMVKNQDIRLFWQHSATKKRWNWFDLYPRVFFSPLIID